jgi:hypothetical protein
MHAGELIFVVVVNMPRKAKPHKSVASSEEVWIAPRPANTSKARTFEPTGTSPSNRYLDFADIALAVNRPSSPKKRPRTVPAQNQHAQHHHDSEGKVTPINSRASNPRGPKHGFGAFRGPR